MTSIQKKTTEKVSTTVTLVKVIITNTLLEVNRFEVFLLSRFNLRRKKMSIGFSVSRVSTNFVKLQNYFNSECLIMRLGLFTLVKKLKL